MSMTAWAFATLGLAHEPLLSSIASEAIRRLPSFATHDLANLV